MSNDMISVPRELLERLERMYMDGMSIYGECEEIRALLASPAPSPAHHWNCPNCPPPGTTHTISGQFYRKADGS